MENTDLRKPQSLFERWQKQLESSPPLVTEESLVFRILVQALVIVGIIATDVAAETQMSLWAIPLSILGATWSWYRRKQRNIAMKFVLAIAMLVMLFVFLGNLVVSLNDSRMALAGLLVQLQVLHSFDLPRRKDLGYSMVIGLILLGIAGTVSQTLAFAPWLLLFLIIALPTLVLDYRSRLELDTIDNYLHLPFQKSQRTRLSPSFLPITYSPLSPARLGAILGITLLLGLSIFAVMPRFPGYQLQTFPVSSPFDANSQRFDEKNRDIVNPGYAKAGKNNDLQQKGAGTSPTEGAGELDSTYYYGFNSKMNQNLRGSMQSKIVLRVRSQSPGFWRALSFDRYTGQGWEISQEEELATLKRSSWSYKFHLSPPSTYMKTKQVIQSYTTVSDLPNVIPSLSYPKYLYFPAREIGLDGEGNLRSPVGLVEGLTYTTISEVPYRDRSVLRQAPYEYSKAIQERYLQLPPEIADKVRQKAIALLSKSPKPINSVYEAAIFLTQAVKQNYQIQDVPFFAENEDLVESFLFRHQGGYGDHFSTVLTVMLRSIGIPARLAVGFGPGQFNPFTGFYLVRNTDAYALSEVYFPYFGWYSFDPIPGHDLIPPSFEEGQTFGVLKQFWNWVAGWLPSPVTSFFGLLWTQVIGGFFSVLAWLWRFISSSVVGIIVGLMLFFALGFFGWFGWLQLRSLSYRRHLAKLPPMARLYQQMLGTLKAKGYPKHPAQTPREYAQVSHLQHPSEQADIIEEISEAYAGWRYGDKPQNVNYLQQQLKALWKSWQKKRAN